MGRKKKLPLPVLRPHLMLLQVHGGMKYNKLYNTATEEDDGGNATRSHLALSEFPIHRTIETILCPRPS